MVKQATKKKQVAKTEKSDLHASIEVHDPPRVVEEIPRKNPNGDPFDTMFARQRKSR